MSVNVCIPTLNAIDDFWRCVESIENSSIDCNIYVVDNGNKVSESREGMVVHRPISNLGVAGSWNWFLDNVPQTRIITNDDVVFEKDAIKTLIAGIEDGFLVAPGSLEGAFSCFIVPDKIIESVGRFDEWISPKYGYFEDNDYLYRMNLNGF